MQFTAVPHLDFGLRDTLSYQGWWLGMSRGGFSAVKPTGTGQRVCVRAGGITLACYIILLSSAILHPGSNAYSIPSCTACVETDQKLLDADLSPLYPHLYRSVATRIKVQFCRVLPRETGNDRHVWHTAQGFPRIKIRLRVGAPAPTSRYGTSDLIRWCLL